MRERKQKRAYRKRFGLSVRPQTHTDKLGPLSELARDLAARIQGNLSGRIATGRRLAPGRPRRATAAGGPLARIAAHMLTMKLSNPIEAIEIELLSQAMITTHGNITAASRLLGIHRKSVERHLAKHKLARHM